jgi:chitobiase/beta-hexosaminidase-like protein
VKGVTALFACLAIAVVVVAESFADAVTGPSLSLSESSANQHVSGSTLYYAPAGSNSGSFTVTATASAGSGIASVAFPAVFGSDSLTDTTSPYSQTYSWTSSASASGAKTVTATDTETPADTGTATFTVTPDTTAPSGQTVALAGGPGYSTLSVPLLLANGTDAASGIDSSSGVVERASATLSNGACGSFGSFSAVTLSGGADTTVTSGNCYRYQYKAADNVGNVSTASTPTTDAKVDSSPPTAPSLLFSGLTNAAAAGSVVYYPPTGSGSFAVTAISTDSDSGIASYAFPSVSGFSVAGAGASRIFGFSGAPSEPPVPLSVTATNGTGLTSPEASFTLVPDPAPPTVTIRCNGTPCLGTAYRKAVVVTLAAEDSGGSGVEAIRFTIDGGNPTVDDGVEYDGAFTVRTLTHVRVRAYDRVGNTSEVVEKTIRSLADRLVFAAPAQLKAKVGARYLQARISSSARAKVTAVMTGVGLKHPQRWRFIVSSGASIVELRLPKAIKRPGRYTLVWNVQTGTRRAKTSTRVVLGGTSS